MKKSGQTSKDKSKEGAVELVEEFIALTDELTNNQLFQLLSNYSFSSVSAKSIHLLHLVIHFYNLPFEKVCHDRSLQPPV